MDLDDTIIEHDQNDGEEFDVSHFGPVKPRAREGMKLLKDLGYIVVVWTTRGNNREIKEFLKRKMIPHNYVNERPHHPEDGSRKLYADLIIDNLALGCPKE